MLKAGASIGNYEIVEPIGAGGMGVVYRARHRLLHRQVALKVLLGNLALSEKVRTRFTQEAYVQANLKHDNIVPVSDLVLEDGSLAIVMELIEGPALEEVLASERPGQWPFEDAMRIVVPVLDAMAHAHSRGVVHRDLKPGNLLLDRSTSTNWPGVVKVTDFGIAKILASEVGMTKTGARMGTLPFMAPEQFRGKKDIGTRSDVFALGMILWRLLAGRFPVNPEDMVEVAYMYTGQTRIPPLQELDIQIPSKLDHEIQKALSIDPAMRHIDAAQLRASISAQSPQSSTVLQSDARGVGPSGGSAAGSSDVLATESTRAVSPMSAAEPIDAPHEGPLGQMKHVRPTPPNGEPQQEIRGRAPGSLRRRTGLWIRENKRSVTVAGAALAIALFAFVAILLVVSGPRIQHCAYWTTRGVEPICIDPIDEDIANQRDVSYRFEMNDSQTTRITRVNGSGVKVDGDSWPEEGVAEWVFDSYDDRGQGWSELDRNGRLIRRVTAVDADHLLANGQTYLTTLVDIHPTPRGDDSAIELDADGFVFEERFVNHAGRFREREGAYGVRVERDALGRVLRLTRLSANGDPLGYRYSAEGDASARTRSGFAATTVEFERDDHGDLIEVNYYDHQGNPVDGEQGFHRSEIQRDTVGRPVLIRYFDAAGEATLDSRWCAGLDITYDDHGNAVEECCVDREAQPTIDRNWTAVLRREFNEEDLVIRESYLDAARNPADRRNACAAVDRWYDEAGRLIVEQHLDLQNAPCLTSNRFSRLELAYDDTGNLIRESYLDTEGQPAVRRDGQYVSINRYYDEMDRLIAEEFCGPDGDLVLVGEGEMRYGRIEVDYSDAGAIIERRYLDPLGMLSYGFLPPVETWVFDENGDPSVNEDRDEAGWLSFQRIATYDDFGRQVELVHADESGEPMYFGGRTIRTYDDSGNLVDIVELSEEGQRQTTRHDGLEWSRRRLAFGISGSEITEFLDENDRIIQVEIREFDHHGRTLERRLTDANGGAVPFPNGSVLETYTYDGRGMLVQIESQFADEDTCLETYRYDDRGYLVEHALSPFWSWTQNGCSSYQFDYNDWGDLVSEECFAFGEQHNRNDAGFFRTTWQYDERGRQTEEAFFDFAALMRRLDRHGAARVETQYDALDRITSLCYFDTEGELVQRTDDDYACVRIAYDGWGNQVSHAYFGIYGQPILHDGEFHQERQRFEGALLKESTLLGTHGELSTAVTVAQTRYEHDELGRFVERAYFDAAGDLSEGPDGYARLTVTYDDAEQSTEQNRYTADGTPYLTRREAICSAVDLTRRGNHDQAVQDLAQYVTGVASAGNPRECNETCWSGAMNGFPETVMPACECGVLFALDDVQRASNRDSRGLARALSGDLDGALEDFESFVDGASDYWSESLVDRRREWIPTLRRGETPFTEEYLEEFRQIEGGIVCD